MTSQTKERPILFSAPMVRAILEGRKTQTRRAVKNLEGRPATSWTMYQAAGCADSWSSDSGWMGRCPYGQPGDRLWVREAFAIVPRTAYARSEGVHQTLRPDDPYNHDAAIYREGWCRSNGGFKWRPSIHMPRWASRILLEVVGVRIEQLHDASNEDCIAEGCPGGHGSIPGYNYSATPAEHFRDLWNTINGEGSWAENPWVWVVEFKALKGGAA